MWLVFALTTPLATNVSIASAFYLAVISPFAEEVVFRGFAFRQLYRHASLGFWPSVL
ncbi:MAG: CPBP family intramembrane metalloprotease, partial [Acidobacteria bacterium]|nr:CPBP family intramembrane metalloprotease [Acidobacteriota bacterium]